MYSEASNGGSQAGRKALLDNDPNSSRDVAREAEIDQLVRARDLGPSLADSWGMAWLAEGWGEPGSECGGLCAQKIDGQEVTVVPLLCGKWSCPVCGRLKYRWFVREVEKAAKGHALQYFWTLTIDHSKVSPAESWDLIMKAWNRFRTTITDRYGPISYIWVLEPQKSGHAHIHVLWSLYLDHGECSELWKKATGGSFVVWVEKVRGKGAARYLAKYVQKSAGYVLNVVGADLTGRHRYGKSRDIHFTPYVKKGKEPWELVPVAFKEYRKWGYASFGTVLDDQTYGVPWFRFLPAKVFPKGIQGTSEAIYWKGLDPDEVSSFDAESFRRYMQEWG